MNSDYTLQNAISCIRRVCVKHDDVEKYSAAIKSLSRFLITFLYIKVYTYIMYYYYLFMVLSM